MRVSTGAFTRSCTFRVAVTGTLTLTVLRQQDAGGRVVHLADDWRETSRVVAPCPGGADLSEHVVAPKGPLGLTYFGDVTRIVLGVTDQGDHDGGFGIRTVAFVGGLGGTTVEGRLIKSSRFSGLVANGVEEHREGYPRTETNVTLVKR